MLIAAWLHGCIVIVEDLSRGFSIIRALKFI